MQYILLALLFFICFLIYRALKFKPLPSRFEALDKVAFDQDEAINNLRKMIQIPTISNSDYTKCDQKQFKHFAELLVELYPNVNKHCERKLLGNTGILYHFKGKSAANPTVLMSHYDVVPIGDIDKWDHPPFSGEIIDNCLWGRGTLDTKITLMATLQATETLLKKGFVPENDIYLSFSGDEEVAGKSAETIVDHLAKQGIKPGLVVDEGGAIVKDIFPTVTKDIAVIGIGEKGIMDVKFTVKGKGGHASTPPIHTALGELAMVINQCEKKPFKSHLSPPIIGLLDRVGRHASFPFRLLLANMWLFKGLLLFAFNKMGGELKAMIQTTQAFTMANASQQANVLPNQAQAVANYRLINNDSPEAVVQHLKAATKNINVDIEVIHSSVASPYTDINNDSYKRVEKAINQAWSNVIVSPYLMIAASDSRHFCKISDNVCRFSAMRLSKEQRGLIHNYNERIELSMISECVTFYLNLIQLS